MEELKKVEENSVKQVKSELFKNENQEIETEKFTENKTFKTRDSRKNVLEDAKDQSSFLTVSNLIQNS